MRGKLVQALDRRWYPGVEDNWDDALLRQRILRRISGQSVILDLGAGAGIVRQMNFRGTAGRVCGVDLDPRVLENQFLHEARIGSAEAIPYGDGEFDVVFADNVLEHLPNPVSAFAEIARVLKPGGSFLAKTPNKWHYMPIVAWLTPHSFHRYYNRLRGRETADTFPTHYLANSTTAIQRLARAAQLEVVEVSQVEGRPEYLRISPLTYAFGRMYERLVNSSSRFASLRILLVIELYKPAQLFPAARAE